MDVLVSPLFVCECVAQLFAGGASSDLLSEGMTASLGLVTLFHDHALHEGTDAAKHEKPSSQRCDAVRSCLCGESGLVDLALATSFHP